MPMQGWESECRRFLKGLLRDSWTLEARIQDTKFEIWSWVLGNGPFVQIFLFIYGVQKDAQPLSRHFGLVNSLPIAIRATLFFWPKTHVLFGKLLVPHDVFIEFLILGASRSTQASARDHSGSVWWHIGSPGNFLDIFCDEVTFEKSPNHEI